MKLTPMHFDVLLTHMLKDGSVLHSACTQLLPEHLRKVNSSIPQSVAFLIISRHFAKYKCAPDIAAFRAGLDAELEGLSAFGHRGAMEAEMSSWLAQFLETIKIVDQKSLGLAKDMISDIHRECVYVPQVTQTVEQGLASGELASLGEQLVSLTTAHNAVKGSSDVRAVVSLGEQVPLMRFPTGVKFIDDCFGGGAGIAGPGVAAIIAPQQGGKTTLGFQIAISVAVCGGHSLLVLAENGWSDRGIQLNALATATGISTKILERAKSIPEAANQAGLDLAITMKRAEIMEERVHILDLAATGGDLTEVDAKLASLKQSGIPVSMVYIDWAGIIAERMVSNPAAGRKFKDVREALTSISNEVVRLSELYGVQIFIAQQMDTKSAKMGRFGKYDMYCAAENKMFTAPFKSVAVITPTGSASERFGEIQVLEWVKARSDANRTRTLVRRTGEFCTFEAVTGVVQKGKRFAEVTGQATGSDFSIPTERKHNSSGTE